MSVERLTDEECEAIWNSVEHGFLPFSMGVDERRERICKIVRAGVARGLQRATEIIRKSMLEECHSHSAPTFCENYGCDDLRLLIHWIDR